MEHDEQQHPASVFHERLAYARLLWHLAHGRAPSNAEIARAAGATSGQWLVPYTKSSEAPSGHRYVRGLLAFFSVSEAWFVDGAGAPPIPRLWAIFIKNYRKAVARERSDSAPTRTEPPHHHGGPVEKSASAKRRRSG